MPTTYAAWFEAFNAYQEALQMRPFSPEEIALQLGILAAPDDDAPRLVYLDWLLEQRGNVWWHAPQIELLQLQVQRAQLTLAQRKRAYELGLELLRGFRIDQLHPGFRVYRRGFAHEIVFRPENAAFILRHPWLAFAQRVWVQIERRGKAGEEAREAIWRSPKLAGATFLGRLREDEGWVLELPFRQLEGVDIESPALLPLLERHPSITELSITRLADWDSAELLLSSPLLGRLTSLALPGVFMASAPVLTGLNLDRALLTRLPENIRTVQTAGFACGFRLRLERDAEGRFAARAYCFVPRAKAWVWR